MIGTLTVHYNANYGANLQAYALRKCIANKSNEDVRVIDYRNNLIRNLYTVRPWNLMSTPPYISVTKESVKRSIKMILNIKGTILRNYRFRAFRKKYVKTTKTVYTVHDIMKLRCSEIIIGSDQIWNESITKDENNVFWGSIKNERNYVGAYAPSFGRSSVTDVEKEKIKKYIRNFDYLTVREPSMVNIIQAYTDKKIEIVCDPVFLLSQDDWLELAYKVEKKYIFVYILERNDEVIKIAKKISDKLKLDVILLCDGGKLNQKIGTYLKTADPKDFISLLTNAEFVITNSFHGTAFSVLFNKNFITIPDTKKSARMLEFLSICGMKNRICYRASDVTEELMRKSIDYDATNKIIKEMKEKSLDCIKDMIDHKG